jgi:hypothetical protein
VALFTEVEMRGFAAVVAGLIIAAPAAAESWMEYSYPDYGFAVTFPVDPRQENGTYQTADGRSVPAHIWSATLNKSMFKVTVADIGATGQEDTIINYAVRLLAQGGEVKVNFPHRVQQVYGRQVSITAPDGSRETAAVFDLNARLYQIEARVMPGGDDTDLIRFQQSLIFTPGNSNRGQDLIRSIREACRGVVNNPAGLDDPRCVRR